MQPAEHAESTETERQMRNLMDVAEIPDEITFDQLRAAPR